MPKRMLPWTAAIVAGLIVAAFVARFITVLVQRPEPPGGGVAVPIARDTSTVASSFFGSDTEPRAAPDTVPPPRSDSGLSRRHANVGPVDSLPRGGTAAQRTIRQRDALDLLLRRGVFFRVKERNATGMRVIIAQRFALETRRYRDPLIRQLYYYMNLDRPPGQPAYIEFWNFTNTKKLGEYVRDTFYFGPLYTKPR